MDEYLIEGKSYQRLYDEYKKYGSLYGAFDFDGTIHDFHKTGASYELVKQLIRDLYSIGCKLDCWTAYIDHSYVISFLKERMMLSASSSFPLMASCSFRIFSNLSFSFLC